MTTHLAILLIIRSYKMRSIMGNLKMTLDSCLEPWYSAIKRTKLRIYMANTLIKA